MSTMINWKLRKFLSYFRTEDPAPGKEARWPVLTCLILHANTRGRAWPTRETIALETGFDETTVTRATKWLRERGAIYVVPHRYLVGNEAMRESQKHVYQLTGVIRLAGELVPYLYLNNEQEEIASALRELAEIGGEQIVEFLTKGRRIHPLPKKRTSLPKGGKVHRCKVHRCKVHPEVSPIKTGKVVSIRSRTIAEQSHDNVEEGRDSHNPIMPTDSVLGYRADDQEQEVDDPDKPIVEPLTAFESYVLAACPHTRVMPERVRPYFRERVKWVDRYNDEHDSPSVIELWDTNPDYQRFVKEIIVDELRDKRLLTPTGFKSWLVSPIAYSRFYGWARKYGDHTDGPDGISPEVPQAEIEHVTSASLSAIVQRVRERRDGAKKDSRPG